jgi:antitoxin (DNA-binding transcriptional repressor) of toxin-antitoxin stability system
MRLRCTCPGLLERVAIGEEVVIVKAGKPVAKLVPIKSSRPRFKLGSDKGQFVVPDDFDHSLPKEIEDLFWNENLLDTHTLLSALTEKSKLSSRVRELPRSKSHLVIRRRPVSRGHRPVVQS